MRIDRSWTPGCEQWTAAWRPLHSHRFWSPNPPGVWVGGQLLELKAEASRMDTLYRLLRTGPDGAAVSPPASGESLCLVPVAGGEAQPGTIWALGVSPDRRTLQVTALDTSTLRPTAAGSWSPPRGAGPYMPRLVWVDAVPLDDGRLAIVAALNVFRGRHIHYGLVHFDPASGTFGDLLTLSLRTTRQSSQQVATGHLWVSIDGTAHQVDLRTGMVQPFPLPRPVLVTPPRQGWRLLPRQFSRIHRQRWWWSKGFHRVPPEPELPFLGGLFSNLKSRSHQRLLYHRQEAAERRGTRIETVVLRSAGTPQFLGDEPLATLRHHAGWEKFHLLAVPGTGFL
ncbi:MAG TPA: hypothetical protein VEI97_10970, partial [bacterium]|nr:hypothetical protein [bacterium]